MEFLCSSIPHEVGVQAVSQWLDIRHPLAVPHNEFLIELLELVLNNNSIFDNKYHRQKWGVAMGGSCAPSYACLHLGWWEREEVYNHPSFEEHVALWVGFIDDVLVVWRGTMPQFELFIRELNDNSRNTFVTYKVDKDQIEFLDLLIRKEKARIVTNTFRKPTAGNTLLHATSHHLWPLIGGIPTGQFLRIRRNCSHMKRLPQRK